MALSEGGHSNTFDPVLNLLVYPNALSNLSDEDGPQFQVAVINTEDNADYIPPKGVKGEYDRINEIQSKEQSLVLKFSNLPPKHTGVAQKTLYTLNDNQKRSFMTYDFMKMYVNGNSPWINFAETDVELFLKFGLGDDYYEITQPIFSGWDEDENRNSFKIDLNYLTIKCFAYHLPKDLLLVRFFCSQ